MSDNVYIFMKKHNNTVGDPLVTDDTSSMNQSFLASLKVTMTEKFGERLADLYYENAMEKLKNKDNGFAIEDEANDVYLTYTYDDGVFLRASLEIGKDITAWESLAIETDTARKYVVVVNDPDYESGVIFELYNDPEFAVLDIATDAEKRDPRRDPTYWEIYEVDVMNKTAALVQSLAADPSLDGRWGSPNYHWTETFGGAHKDDPSRIALRDLQKKKKDEMQR